MTNPQVLRRLVRIMSSFGVKDRAAGSMAVCHQYANSGSNWKKVLG
jgi:hypothetical protein